MHYPKDKLQKGNSVHVNTALEMSLDFINGNKFHPHVKLVKDIVAAGVLLASLNAVIVGALIFLKYIHMP